MPNGQIGQDKKNPFKKETELPGQEPSIFEKETEVLASTVDVVEIPFLEELEEAEAISPELLRTISQAQATFAPEATFAFPGALMTPLRNVLARPGEITLDDIFSGEVGPLMPVASSELGIKAISGPIGTGVIGGTVRGAINITKALAARPLETVLGFVTAPAVITYQGLKGFINDTALPNITIAGNEDALELVRERFVGIIGEMSPEERDEAHRAFAGLLAAAATGGLLFRTVGGPSFKVARQLGAEKAVALKQAKFIRAQTTAIASLGVFGAVGGETTEKEKNFVMFALAAIPLGLTFAAFRSIKAKTPEITDGPGRASSYQQQRAARPFNQETTVVPEIKVEPVRKEAKPVDIEPELTESFTDLIERVGVKEARRLSEEGRPGEPLEKPGEVVGEIVPSELGPKEPKAEPLNPEVLATRLDNYVKSEGDIVRTILQNLETEPSGMVIVPSTKTPARTLALVKEIAGEDAIVAVHLRLDGRFDIAVGRENSLLENIKNLKQFIDEGYFVGQEVSVNGKNMVYVAREENQSIVRIPGDSREIKVNTEDIRRPKDVGVKGLPEAKEAIEFAAIRTPDGEIFTGQLHIEAIQKAVDAGKLSEEFIRRIGISARELAKEQGVDLDLFQTSRGRAVSREEAVSIADKVGQFESVSSRKAAIERGFLDAKEVDFKPEFKSAEKQLEGVITPEEIKVFKALREEVHPTEPSTEPKTFDQIRQEASTNGLELTRTASNTFIVRDRATGAELFKGATKEEAEAFINKSGQDGTVVFDGNIPIDTGVPGGVMPPPPPGLRVNEPFDFPPNTRVGTIIDWMQSTRAGAVVTPFGHWASATDNILGTRISTEVFFKTQETKGRSVSGAIPWLKTLQKEVERMLVDAKLSRSEREQITHYIETRSAKDLRGSHKEGLGPLKSRSMTKDEISAADLLLELDIDTMRLYEYIRLRTQLLDAEARILRTKVENLDPTIRRDIEREIIDKKNMTPNEMVGVQIFDSIRAQDLNDVSLYVVNRLVEAERGGALSQADFAAKNKMSAVQMEAANKIVKIQDDVAAIPDVPIDDAQLIRGYMAHYAQQQTIFPEASILNQVGVSRDMSFVNAMIRSGETNVYEMDPVAITAKYIRNAFDAIEFNDAWNDAKRYVDANLGGQFGRDGSVAGLIAKSYLTEIRGIPAASTKHTRAITEAFFKKMGWKMDPDILRTLVNMQLAFTNAAFMGARPGLAVRDLMQTAVFHYSRFGGALGKRTMRALTLATLAAKGEGMKQLRDAGELPTIGIIEFETAKELEASAIGRTMRGLPELTKKMAEVGLTLSLQRNAYEFTYTGVLLEAKETAFREISRLVSGGISKEKAYENIALDTYNLQTKKAFDTFVTNGEYERAANFLGQQTAREMMGVYGRANHPWGWGTTTGRLLTHYGTWSANAMSFMLAGVSRGSKKQRSAFAARFALTQAGLLSASNAVGINIHSWMVLPGLFFTGGPAVQTAGLILTSLTGYGVDKDMARERLKRLLPAWDDPRSVFIPFSYVMGDLRFAVENADNPIEFFSRGFSIPLKRGRSWLDDF